MYIIKINEEDTEYLNITDKDGETTTYQNCYTMEGTQDRVCYNMEDNTSYAGVFFAVFGVTFLAYILGYAVGRATY